MQGMSLTPDVSGIRIDKYLADEIEILSRSKIKRYIQNNGVLVDGHPVKPSYRIHGSEIIRIDIPEERPTSLRREDLSFDILYEDDEIVVVNKPAGLVVHPGAGNRTGTLVNGLLWHFDSLSEVSGKQRPGIVHRLDRDTSGVLVVAKTDRSHMHVARQFAERTVEKTYMGLVWGVPGKEKGVINAPIVRHPKHRQKFIVGDSGRDAITEYRLLRKFGHLALLELKPRTGRTHQIRVHGASIGHPVFADRTYGGGRSRATGYPKEQRQFLLALFDLIQRQALHALMISLKHPSTGKRVEYVAPVPEDFQSVLHRLELWDE